MLKSLTRLYVLTFIAVMIVCGNVVRADVVTDGLVGYWSMDAADIDGKTVKDPVGGNDGEMVGKPKIVQGKIGDALEFGGENSVDIVGTDALNFNGKEELTVSAWVNADSDDPVNGVVAGCCGSIVAQRDANGWAMRYDGRNGGLEMEFIVQPGWQGDGGFGAPRIPEGEWHYLTGVVDNDQMLFYLDGELAMEQPYSGPISTGGPETDIGHASDGGFIGIIDEVLIYDRALSAKEIKQNFESKVFAAVEPANKLATYWGKVKTSR